MWCELEAPEGHRVLTVFEHLDGGPPRGVLADIEVMGAGLADIHNAGERYAGPASLYTLNLGHLCAAPLTRLLAAPTVDADLAAGLAAAADAPGARIRPHADSLAANGLIGVA
jgi:Ser/Thr protein kinase RdoA (MazF antagonist)